MYKIFDTRGASDEGRFATIEDAIEIAFSVYSPESETYKVVYLQTGETVAIVHENRVWKPVDAAAPDLLAACQRAQTALKFVPRVATPAITSEAFYTHLQEAIDDLGAAIAAAKGEATP